MIFQPPQDLITPTFIREVWRDIIKANPKIGGREPTDRVNSPGRNDDESCLRHGDNFRKTLD
jgi:hypothetical protein